MIEVRSPKEATVGDVFLAGGIMNASNWQPTVVNLLAHTEAVIFNPRRSEEFTPEMHEPQVKWEYHALRNSKAILFWFPPETLCPITLYELGVWSEKNVPIYVGTHPDYQRRTDVQIQLGLSRPEVIVHSSLDDLVNDYLANHWS